MVTLKRVWSVVLTDANFSLVTSSDTSCSIFNRFIGFHDAFTFCKMDPECRIK